MKQIELGKILDNPYQPRTTDNAEHISSLAQSIAADGLLQVPTARAMPGGTYQLAFGHSRRKAFEFLNERFAALELTDRYQGYGVMPVNIAELTDEEMYRYAVSENVQRKDLDALEMARAMVVYRDQFGKTSDEIGALFGMSGSTVRGVVRLLDLPEALQGKVSAGEISQGAARMLLSAQKLISGDDMLRVVESAQDSPEDGTLEYQLDGEIERLEHVVSMWSDWSDESGKKAQSRRYGNGWALDIKKFPNELLTGLTYKDVIDGLRIKDTPRLGAIYDALIDAGKTSYADLLTKLKETNDPEAERIEWLQKPGACNVCPYYAKIDGKHYCGMNVCHKRKIAAWNQHLFQKAIKDLGIPVYQESDGPYRVLDDDTEKGLWTKRNKDLRLFPKGTVELRGYQWLEGFDRDLGWVVLTGATLSKQKQAKKEKDTEALEEAMSVDERAEAILERAEPALAWEASRTVAQFFFEGWSQAQLEALKRATYSWRSFHTPPGLTFADEGCGSQLAVFLGRNIVEGADIAFEDDAYDLENCKQAAEIAVHWGQVVSTLGCELPKSLTTIAEDFDAQLAAVRVAVETEV